MYRYDQGWSRGVDPYGPMNWGVYPHTSYDVVALLQNPKTRRDQLPAYYFGVIKAYCEIKIARGKSKADIKEKIVYLEQEIRWRAPQFERCFDEIRAYYHLGPSRMGPRNSTAGIGHYPGQVLHVVNSGQSRSSSSRASASAAAASSVAARPPVNRASDEPGDEAPPPPYSTQDPEPEATAVLMAIQQAEGPDATATSSILNPNASGNGSGAVSGSGNGSDNGNGNGNGRRDSELSVPPSPGQRGRRPRSSLSLNGRAEREQERRESLNANLDPHLDSAASAASASLANNPPPPNESEEDQRIREESELEEAKRLSRLSEKERLEYERAIQASIASYEEDSSLRSIAEEHFPGEGPAGPSSRVADNRRASSHHPTAGPSYAQMQRSATHHAVGYDGGPSAGPSAPSTAPTHLMDAMDSLDMNAAPALTPTSLASSRRADNVPLSPRSSPGIAPGPAPGPAPGLVPGLAPPAVSAASVAAPALVASQTGTSWKSNNPFLPDPERTRIAEEHPTATDMGPPPTPPKEEVPQYAAPHGPPPGWVGATPGLAHAPPPPARSPQPPPVPPLPPRVAAPPLPPRSNTGGAAGTGGRYLSPISTTGVADVPSSLSPSLLTPEATTPTHYTPQHSPYGAPQSPYAVLQSPYTAPQSPYAVPQTQPQTQPQPHLQAQAQPQAPDSAVENALEMLREYDTIFLIDDSTSMKGERWHQAQAAIMGVVEQAVMYDDDGIDVFFLNSKRVGKGLGSRDDVEELFAGLEPKGATPTGLRIESILRDYMSRLERATADGETVRSMNLIVVTDGAFAVPVLLRKLATSNLDHRLAMLDVAPTDDPESVLTTIARRLDRGDYPLSQVGVQLLQIGDDPEAAEALKELDEGLSAAHGVRDMVDTVPYRGEAMTSDLIVKVLLGGINRRIDRRH